MEFVRILGSLEGLPCHLSWLEEKLGGYCTLEENKRDFVATKWLLNCYKDNEGKEEAESDSILDKCNPQNPRYAALFSRNLNQASRALYGGDWKGAKENLNILKGYLPELTGEEHGRLKEPLEYLMECLEWAADKLQLEEKLVKLKGKWEGIRGDSKSMAVLEFMKANVKSPGRRDEGYLDDLRKVIKLDPNFFIWRHHAFKALRLARQDKDKANVSDRRPFKVFSAPSKEEIEMAQTAYQVAGGNPKPEIVIADVITMLVDCLMLNEYPKMYPRAVVDPCPLVDQKEARRMVLQLSEELLERVKNLEGNVNVLEEKVVKIVVKKAEVLMFVNSTEGSRQEGRQLLHDYLTKYPANGFLWWKLGTIYKTGLRNTVDKQFKNLDEARRCFVEAIKLKHQAVKCLREYLNLLPNPSPPFLVNVAFRFLNEAIERGKENGIIWKDSQAVDVGIWRGCLLWWFTPLEGGLRVNRQEACKTWVKVWMKYPEFRDGMVMSIRNQGFCPKPIDMEELRGMLESLKWEVGVSREEKKGMVGLLEEVDKCRGKPSRKKNEAGGLSRGTTSGYPGGRTTGKGSLWEETEADRDSNWRR